jgi:asparagine synthase (glutamine-hydrolysing)
MCGFAGTIDASDQARGEDLCHSVRTMADAVRHRGPDDAGVWNESGAPVAMAFQRLAILDLTDAGHQPQLSHDGRLAIVFNGEIYNHLNLRDQLSENGDASTGPVTPTPKRCSPASGVGCEEDARTNGRHVRARAVGPSGPSPPPRA